MLILIPMAGAGSRFKEKGYAVHKPAILTTSLKSGKKIPMVIAATQDLPDNETAKIIYIDRDFHKTDGIQDQIKKFYPNAKFITINYLTQGQATTCLLAKEYIYNSQELLIAGCDNGMVMNYEEFNLLKKDCDAIIFTYRNTSSVLHNPNAYGWVIVDKNNNATSMSVKKNISNHPLNDHAVVATFWFKHGSIFVDATEEMINQQDIINGEYYIDQTMQHVINFGYKVKVFEVQRYIGWGTPKDYENYENTINYWQNFIKTEKI